MGDLRLRPTPRELSFNVVKLTERIGKRLLDKKRITIDGTWCLLDGVRLYDRAP